MARGPHPWGWHRLGAAWAARLVADARVRRGATVLDVGAGDGALTAALLAAGARVVAVELHPERCAELRRRFAADVGAGRLVVVRADAAALRFPRHPFAVVANPPFAVTSALLRRLLQPGSRLVSADLVLAAPAAARWSSGRAPAIDRWIRTFDVSLGPALPRHAFTPASPVDARVLRLRRR